MQTTPYAADVDELTWRARRIAGDMDARIAIDRILIRSAHEARAEAQNFRTAVDRIAEAAPYYPVSGRKYLVMNEAYRLTRGRRALDALAVAICPYVDNRRAVAEPDA